jgi:hypothetical protein
VFEAAARVLLGLKPLALRARDFKSGLEFYRGNAAIAVEGEQNAVDHCGNHGNLLPYCAINFYTIHCTLQ